MILTTIDFSHTLAPNRSLQGGLDRCRLQRRRAAVDLSFLLEIPCLTATFRRFFCIRNLRNLNS